MNLAISKLVSSILEIILFSLIPFIWWLITARKECSFFQWIGLKKPEGDKRKILLWVLCVFLAFLALSVFMLWSVKGVETATADFAGLGAAAIPAILIYAILNTSMPEEILFRGFLLKRSANRFGFTTGNIFQATLFGMMHGIMFWSAAGPLKSILIILFTGGIGWCTGYANEKTAGGSILPGWCIHALANIFSGICSAFLLF